MWFVDLVWVSPRVLQHMFWVGALLCRVARLPDSLWPSTFIESLRVALLFLALPDLLGHVEIVWSQLLDLLSECVDR